ncbi:hypothetical protein EIP86_011351 [Pleurotus ostreatoroseus]|nr:hypothetical protein EIP86_011351 [Pleurotus ostreatoroseus]
MTKTRRDMIFNAQNISETYFQSSASRRDPATVLVEGSNEWDQGPSAKRSYTQDSTLTLVDSIDMEMKSKIATVADLTGSGDNLPIELRHQVRHHVAVPSQYHYTPISDHVPPTKPAREYKFVLDPFQQVSIYAIQRTESVLVSAHTSAGKTVVAEYAIAQCLQRNQRVIYTSPIKALSNQKYRELLAEFGDVGLLTGDVTINPSAACLVMTTEILRSMLYRGSEVIREAAWVIFDEVHYMRDATRGVVWEESIILLPHTVRYVFLSATLPNATAFAEWICRLHEQPCHVVYTDFRPTPLQHYIFPADGDGIYLVLNEKGEFKEDNFHKAMDMLQHKQQHDTELKPASASKGRMHRGGSLKGNMDIRKIVKLMMAKNHSPVIFFAFSKRECEALALSLSEVQYSTPNEEQAINTIFVNAIRHISTDDSQLPQLVDCLPLLLRGIGIHHGGLLPLLKEIIELLFQEGLLKVLFATETFSIGLNMPAKTVVFTSTRKFDGDKFRHLSSGEYIQMSGRAGRRGLDDRGVVIMMCDEKMEPSVVKSMLTGTSDPLTSAFRLSYNMILNLMRVEGVDPMYMVERSFAQFQHGTQLPSLQHKLRHEEEILLEMVVPNEQLVTEYAVLRQQLDEMRASFRKTITQPIYILPFLQPGRLVKIKYEGLDFGWGTVVSYQASKDEVARAKASTPKCEQILVDVLLNCEAGSRLPMHASVTHSSAPVNLPCRPGQRGEPRIIPVNLPAIEEISFLRLHLPADIRSPTAQETVRNSIFEVVDQRFEKNVPLLDPVLNMGIVNDEFKILIEKIGLAEHSLTANPLHGNPRLPELYDRYLKKKASQQRVRDLKRRISVLQNDFESEELKTRKRVLRRLGFITAVDTVELKGRVACEIQTGDELLLTELLFDGVFNSLSPDQCAGILSCFVVTEKSNRTVALSQNLVEPLRAMQHAARRVAQVLQESKVQIVQDEYVQSFRVEFIDVILRWCAGASFRETFELAGIFEGSLIRMFRRLQELIRQMSQAAKVVGSSELTSKFEHALEMLELVAIVFMKSAAAIGTLVASLATVGAAQRLSIVAPTNGSTVPTGSPFLVRLHQDNSQGVVQQVSVTIALAPCYGPCGVPSTWPTGTILYNGAFDPGYNSSLPPQVGLHEDFELTLPDGWPTGENVLQVAHIENVGAALTPVFEYTQVKVFTD